MNRPRIGRHLLLLLSLVIFGMPAFAGKLEAGMEPPDSLGKDANGTPVRISEHRGKIVIVSFWAAWCPPCRKELPVLDALQKTAGADKVRVFSINWKEPAARFRRLQRNLKDVSLTLLSDSLGDIGAQYEVKAIPHMVIIGRDGKISSIHRGYSDSMIDGLIEEINTLWRQGEEPPAATETAAVN
ncbi:TlpA family protein disulfide reductase [Peristeroidobacter soli]|jgi:thiol-disulfide isomerase/thioredoxin|uniref:TlpA family protein disulfide reductase n=1 Tax=Peristeroidobacter soli TaxID=2497877 RepID=UPI0013007738|nr:TlpA disulfide reductase family protein [Peristeroidobacter soli]